MSKEPKYIKHKLQSDDILAFNSCMKDESNKLPINGTKKKDIETIFVKNKDKKIKMDKKIKKQIKK